MAGLGVLGCELWTLSHLGKFKSGLLCGLGSGNSDIHFLEANQV
jgi:hypothetical protein